MTQPLVRIRLRDFLMPARLLAVTDATDNPFVRHGERRLRRVPRMAARLGLGLLLGAAVLVFLVPGWFGMELPSPRGWGWAFRDALWRRGPLGSVFAWPALCLFSFLVLRYHLFANDQSHHLKSIAREQLEHLMLSRLGPNEYYLHHFLIFCLRYDVIVGLALAFGVAIGGGMVSAEWRWVESDFWQAPIALLCACLLAWTAGAAQYVAEWRMFAASPRPWLRLPTSFAFSAMFAVAIATVAFLLLDAHLLAGLFWTLVLFAVSAGFVHAMGRSLYGRSETILWNRFVGPRSAETRDAPETGRSGSSAWKDVMRGVLLPFWPVRRLETNPRELAIAAACATIAVSPVLFMDERFFTWLFTDLEYPIRWTWGFLGAARWAVVFAAVVASAASAASRRPDTRVAAIRAAAPFPFLAAAAYGLSAAVAIVVFLRLPGNMPRFGPPVAFFSCSFFATHFAAIMVEWLLALAACMWAARIVATKRPTTRIVVASFAAFLACAIAVHSRGAASQLIEMATSFLMFDSNRREPYGWAVSIGTPLVASLGCISFCAWIAARGMRHREREVPPDGEAFPGTRSPARGSAP